MTSLLILSGCCIHSVVVYMLLLFACLKNEVVEEYLEKSLRSKIKPFSMDKFLTLLQ